MRLRRLDTQILRATEVGRIYTVCDLSDTVRVNHHEVRGSMSRLVASGYFQIFEREPFEYIRQEGGQ